MEGRNWTRLRLIASTVFCLFFTGMVAAFITDSIDMDSSIYLSREFGIVFNIIFSVVHYFMATDYWRKLKDDKSNSG